MQVTFQWMKEPRLVYDDIEALVHLTPSVKFTSSVLVYYSPSSVLVYHSPSSVFRLVLQYSKACMHAAPVASTKSRVQTLSL